MAQNDIQHIGDSQNPQWWGAKQGLFINALASQYGQFTIDANWENTINQNTLWSFEVRTKGEFVMTNSFAIGVQGIYFVAGSRGLAGVPQIKDTLLLMREDFFQGTIITNRITRPTNVDIHLYSSLSYNGVLHYSVNPPTFDAIIPYSQRVKEFNKLFAFSNTPFLSSHNLYPIGLKTMRLNFGNLAASNVNNYATCVVNGLRIYNRLMTDEEVPDNYHSFTATNTTNLFCEWKMSEVSDFYEYAGNLYAKNTGSSGNTNQDGTGYDMQVIGYNLNTPIFQSIYP